MRALCVVSRVRTKCSCSCEFAMRTTRDSPDLRESGLCFAEKFRFAAVAVRNPPPRQLASSPTWCSTVFPTTHHRLGSCARVFTITL
jgi:hypothetical protein